MKLITLFLISTLFVNNTLANNISSTCSNFKFTFSESELIEVKAVLKGTVPHEEPPSKIVLAASIGDINYIKTHKNFDTLFEAMYVTLSSDMVLFEELITLLKPEEINKRSKEQVTLLMMASAFMGNDFVKKAYEEAMKEKYNFYSYGDAMLII